MSAIVSKSPEEVAAIAAAGRVVAQTLARLRQLAVAGAVPADLDAAARELMAAAGATPAFLGYEGFPAAVCISVDAAVMHGVPSQEPLQPGDVVCLDVGAELDGWIADAADTVIIGPARPRETAMLVAARRALSAGVAACRPGGHVGDISRAVHGELTAAGFAALDGIGGHGIGRALHEDPCVPNAPHPEFDNVPLREGMVLCVEPIVVSDPRAVELPGGALGSVDGLPGVHVEHTVAVTAAGPLVLTR